MARPADPVDGPADRGTPSPPAPGNGSAAGPLERLVRRPRSLPGAIGRTECHEHRPAPGRLGATDPQRPAHRRGADLLRARHAEAARLPAHAEPARLPVAVLDRGRAGAGRRRAPPRRALHAARRLRPLGGDGLRLLDRARAAQPLPGAERRRRLHPLLLRVPLPRVRGRRTLEPRRDAGRPDRRRAAEGPGGHGLTARGLTRRGGPPERRFDFTRPVTGDSLPPVGDAVAAWRRGWTAGARPRGACRMPWHSRSASRPARRPTIRTPTRPSRRCSGASTATSSRSPPMPTRAGPPRRGAPVRTAGRAPRPPPAGAPARPTPTG